MEVEIFNLNMNELFKNQWPEIIMVTGLITILVTCAYIFTFIKDYQLSKEEELLEDEQPLDLRGYISDYVPLKRIITVFIIGILLATFQISKIEAVNSIKESKTADKFDCDWLYDNTYQFGYEIWPGMKVVDNTYLYHVKENTVKVKLLEVEESTRISFLFGVAQFNFKEERYISYDKYVYANTKYLNQLCGENYVEQHFDEDTQLRNR